MVRRFRSLAVFAALVLLPRTAGAAIQYTVTDLGVYDSISNEVYANSINDSGQIAGTIVSYTNGYHKIAFRTAPNAPFNPITDTLGGLGGGYAEANGINNLGQVAGTAYMPDGYLHAYRTGPNAPIDPLTDDLGTLGGPNSTGDAINDLGQVTGYSLTPDNYRHVYKTAPNGAITLASDINPANSNESYGTAINNAGQVAGYAYAIGAIHSWAFRASGVVNPLTDDIGLLTMPGVIARAMNNSGQVAGTANVVGVVNQYHSFLTGPNENITPSSDIEVSYDNLSQAYGINDAGDVVGTGAYLRTHDRQWIDLNSVIDPAFHWQLWQANDINNLGQIVGYGRVNSYFTHAFLLTPLPEPGTFALAATGVIALLRRRRMPSAVRSAPAQPENCSAE